MMGELSQVYLTKGRQIERQTSVFSAPAILDSIRNADVCITTAAFKGYVLLIAEQCPIRVSICFSVEPWAFAKRKYFFLREDYVTM